VARLTPLEVATGLPFGAPGRLVPLPRPDGTAREALERAMLAALRRPPCLVSFSGGRDSSTVLAAAAALARREGLPAPVPATLRAPASARADETSWQERVIAHVGLDDWLRIEIHDELDAVGPYAARVLRRHGLLWPFNVHFHLPLLDLARGGSLLTGIGGDELFAVASRPTWRRRAFAWAPPPLRRAVLARREPVESPWLTPAARTAATAARAAEAASEPRGLRHRMAWMRGLRYLDLALDAIGLVAADADVEIAHPLFDGALWASAAASGAFQDRTDGMRALFGDLLPPEVLERRSKAGFDAVFFNSHSRAFARSWDGTGAPDGLIDAGVLREHWLGDAPTAQTFTLLQALWLARDRVQQPLGALAQ
jgi:asparagine synthetase B (glutamine-hydrolysing)